MVTLRHATGADFFDFYRWFSDVEVQRFVGTPKYRLDLQGHADWFAQRLKQPYLYVAEAPSYQGGPIAPVGGIRLDEHEGRFWVSLVVDPDVRGHGYGTQMIQALPDVAIWARVHQFNAPSQKAFEKAGYQQDVASGVWKIYRKEAA